jgi:membrane-associated protein
MAYPRFLAFSAGSSALWVLTLVYLGVLFGNMPIVKQNLVLAILVIIAVSVTPLAVEFLRRRLKWAKSVLYGPAGSAKGEIL